MAAVMFNFTKNLRFSRFAIEVLTQRLGHLESSAGSVARPDQSLDLSQASVAACAQLHDQLQDQLRGLNSHDDGAVAPWVCRFEELQRRIRESLSHLDSCEYRVGSKQRP